MRLLLRIPVSDVTPSAAAILEAQGVPRERHDHERTQRLARAALGIFSEKAAPAGILMEVSREAFITVFRGEGRNEPRSPVGPIAEASSRRALFAATVGESLTREIAERFSARDFALASMLDAAASAGADIAARTLEDRFRRHCAEGIPAGTREEVLRFSPGYCGWHVSSQRKLFEILRPGEIGMTLNESFLMQPLKSVTGVIFHGRPQIFFFDDVFPFCKDCADHTCRDRIRDIMNQ